MMIGRERHVKFLGLKQIRSPLGSRNRTGGEEPQTTRYCGLSIQKLPHVVLDFEAQEDREFGIRNSEFPARGDDRVYWRFLPALGRALSEVPVGALVRRCLWARSFGGAWHPDMTLSSTSWWRAWHPLGQTADRQVALKSEAPFRTSGSGTGTGSGSGTGAGSSVRLLSLSIGDLPTLFSIPIPIPIAIATL